MAKPFIEPVQLKRERHGSDDGPRFWFAIWNVRRHLACALGAGCDKLELYEQSLNSAKRAWGDDFCGSFHTQREAEAFAVESLTAGSQTARHGESKRGLRGRLIVFRREATGARNTRPSAPTNVGNFVGKFLGS
jgi:hypothetical protein